MTMRVSPSADRPAVSANGTVKPSERPIVASEISRASIRREQLDGEGVFVAAESWSCSSSFVAFFSALSTYVFVDERDEESKESCLRLWMSCSGVVLL